MKVHCENVSNRGNGENCKISPKNPLLQSCSFNSSLSKINGGIKEEVMTQGIKLCKDLNNCYAKNKDHDYWKAIIVPQVQAVLCKE